MSASEFANGAIAIVTMMAIITLKGADEAIRNGVMARSCD